MARAAKWGEAQAWVQTAAQYNGEDCLIWPFSSRAGYGVVARSGVTLKAHRIVCEMAYGPVGDDRHCAHSCGNALCCNPRHLRWATRAENEADKLLHGRSNRGERQGGSILTADSVLAIRKAKLAGARTGDLSRLYGVSPPNICHIVNRTSWSWL